MGFETGIAAVKSDGEDTRTRAKNAASAVLMDQVSRIMRGCMKGPTPEEGRQALLGVADYFVFQAVCTYFSALAPQKSMPSKGEIDRMAEYAAEASRFIEDRVALEANRN